MIYTPLTIHAMQFLFAHMVKENDGKSYRMDKGGVAYVFHPWHVAESMPDEISTTAALLHDVVEDTPVTLQDLEEEGFPKEVVDAVDLLTHPKDMSYEDYVKRLAPNPIARAVKLSDLAHNSITSRLPKALRDSEKEKRHLARYQWAENYLLDYGENRKEKLQIKRIYEPKEKTDGCRILVDRLWPRGIKKENAAIAEWGKEIAPDNDLRKSFHAGNVDFPTFRSAYLSQLDHNPEAHSFAKHVQDLLAKGNVTILYSAKNEKENNAVVLLEWLEKRMENGNASGQTAPKSSGKRTND